MANTIGWGKGTQNNTNGWGKYQNTIDAGSVYADSYAGETVLICTCAAFSYSASSFHQGEADPTPTITGTTGGTFSATPSGLSINTSTGTIDLDNSTIQSYTITYTVSGVSANFSLAVTASPFIANNFSMNFDSASSQYIQTNVDLAYTTFPNISLACWVKMNKSDLSNFTIYYPVGVIASAFPNGSPIRVYAKNLSAGGSTVIVVQGSTSAETSTDLSDGNWHHIVQTCEYDSGGTICNVYVDGTKEITNHLLRSYAPLTGNLFIGSKDSTSNFFEGKVDEVAAWSTILTADAITEIYNATANNTGKVLDLNTDSGNYNASSNLVYFNRLGD